MEIGEHEVFGHAACVGGGVWRAAAEFLVAHAVSDERDENKNGL